MKLFKFKPPVLVLFFSLILPLGIAAQNGIIKLPSKTINKNQVLINKRVPIKFETILLKDEKGNILPDNHILTMKNGDKVSVNQLSADLNKLEQELCANGYTLRKKGSADIFKGLRYDEQRVDAQLKRVNSKGKYLSQPELSSRFNKPTATVGGRVVKPITLYSKEELNGLNANPVRVMVSGGQLKPITQPSVGVQPNNPLTPPDKPVKPNLALKTINVDEMKVWELGDPDIFSVKLVSGVKSLTEAWRTTKSLKDQTAQEVEQAYLQTATQFGVKAEAKADMNIFGASLNLMDCRSYVHSDAKGSNMKVQLYTTVADVTIMDINKSYNGQNSFSYADREELSSWDVSAGYCVPVWYFRICGEVGTHGSIGVNVVATGTRSGLQTNIEPFIKANGYMSVGLDAYVLGVSLKERLTVLDAQLPIYYESQMWYTGLNFLLYHNLYAGYEVKAMSGVIGIEAWMGCCECPRICIPFLGCLDDLCLRDFFPIWEHSGLSTSGVLFEDGSTLTNLVW